MMCSVFQRILFFTSLWKLLFALNGTIEIERITMNGLDEIERHNINYTHEKWTYQPDTFKIPLTKCSSDISVYCGAMSGHSVGGCKCECNSERTTFGFFDDQWNCTENSKVRQYGGCLLTLLRNRTVDSALITVPLRMEANISFVIPTDLQRCYIIPFKSTYLLCNGSWNILVNNFVYSRFLIVESENTQFFTFKKTTSHLDYNDAMKGRILRMTIGCYNKSNTIIPDCLLLKMQGTLKCPEFSLPSLPKPTTSPWTIQTTSEIDTSKNDSLQTHSSHTSQSTTMESTTFIDNRKKNATEENDGGNTWWIIGVAAGVIGLTLIIVVIVIVMRRRKKRKAAAAKSKTTVENVSYEIGVDNSLKMTDYDGHKSLDQDEYSYAYTNTITLGRRNMSNGHPNKDPQNTVSNDGKVEGLDKHGSAFHPSAGPVFKVLEAPEYAEINNPKKDFKDRPYFDSAMYNKKVVKAQKSNSPKEPLYNVLEDPGSLNDLLEGREAPCYQVLEGPFPEGAPSYDVIVQPPSSDNPEYESLEGQNPRVYSTLNRGDDTKRNVTKACNYSVTLYDSVGEVII